MKLNNNDDSHNSGLNLLIYNMLLDIESHPTWVCGLKQAWILLWLHSLSHTLRGCVDWNKPYGSTTYNQLVTPYVGVWIETFYGCYPCLYWCHTLRGCVDWNMSGSAAQTGAGCHTLRGCVDWNRTKSPSRRLSDSHTLRGCVDWNHLLLFFNSKEISSHPTWVCGLKLTSSGSWSYQSSHTLRGCVDWNRPWCYCALYRQSHPTWVCGLKHAHFL